MTFKEVDAMVDELNELHKTITMIKEADATLRMGFSNDPGSLLDAYREGDVSFDECVKLLIKTMTPQRRAMLLKEIKEMEDD